MEYSTITILSDAGLFFSELGIVLILALSTTIFLKKFGIPNVLGLILGGLLINVFVNTEQFFTDFESLEVIITQLALAYIGYKIGNEIDFGVLKTKGKRFIIVLMGEALGAFIAIFFIIYLVTNNLGVSLLLGSIGMATAPAATALVLSEFKAEGELTQTVLFIIAFDDTLAILFVNISLGFIAHEGAEFFSLISLVLFDVLLEIIMAILVALTGVFIIILLLKAGIMKKAVVIEWIFGVALMLIGISILLEISSILVMFVWGMAIKYLENHSEELEEQMEKVEVLSLPILSLFFILVGLLMEIELLFEITFVTLAILYFVFRSAGKSFGAYVAVSNLEFSESTRKNLPLCLLTQAGVAIGLASLSYTSLIGIGRQEDAFLIINIIGISVIIAELLGPFLVKKAIFRAGEAKIGRE